jgi:hypothetical protein
MLFGKYASRKSEAKHPDAWNGLILSACPSITGPTGTKLYDLSGRHQVGTFGASFAPATDWARSAGQYHISMGSSKLCNFGSAVPTITGGKISVGCWFRFSTTLTNAPLIARWGSAFAYTLLVPVGSNNKMSFFINTSSGINGATTTGTYADGLWHHACGCFDGAQVGIVIDGGRSEAVFVAHTGSMVAAAAENVVLGNYSNSTGNFFTGDMDDVRISSELPVGINARARGIGFSAKRAISFGQAITFRAAWVRNRSQVIGGGLG